MKKGRWGTSNYRVVTKEYKGLKALITTLSGIAVFIGVFLLDRMLINHVVSLFVISHNIALLIKIALWIVTFGVTFWLAVVLGTLIGGVMAIVLGL